MKQGIALNQPLCNSSSDYLSELVEQAGGLGNFIADPANAALINEWRQSLNADLADAFDRRFEREFESKHLISTYYSSSPPNEGLEPNEPSFLQKLFSCSDYQRTSDSRHSGVPQTHPFTEVVAPLSDRTLQLLFSDRKIITEELFAPCAIDELRSSLDRALLEIMVPLIQSEVALCSRASGAFAAARRLEKLKQLKMEMAGDEIAEIFVRYPVLARIVSERLQVWISTFVVFIDRLRNDRVALEQMLGIPAHEKVVSISPELSDRHHGGKTVVAIRFEQGLSILYKPRDLTIDVVFSRLCDWMNERFGSSELRVPRVVNWHEYGWTEYIKHQVCTTENELRSFYRRSGVLLGLLDLLDGNDCHLENIIAHGEYPVLIDPETLFHAPLRLGRTPTSSNETSEQAAQMFVNSVARLGYLPAWHCRPGSEQVRDLSALGAVQVSIKAERFDGVPEADQAAQILLPRPSSSPLAEGEFLPEFAPDAVIAGYRECLDLLRSNLPELLGDKSPLKGFRTLKSRVVIRPTEEYGLVYERSLHLDCLSSGVRRGLVFELLARKLLPEHVDQNWFAVFLSERKALERGDIPHFSMPIDGTALTLPEGVIVPNVVSHSAWSRMLDRVSKLTDTHAQQFNERIIKESIVMKTVATLSFSDPAPKATAELAAITIDDVMQIADTLISNTLSLSDGSTVWMLPQSVHPAAEGKYRHTITKPDLYEGTGGIALFFAALYVVSGCDGYKDSANAALGIVKSQVKHLLAAKEPISPGLGAGQGALLYTLSANARLLNDDTLLDYAEALVDMWLAGSPVVDTAYDVIGGSAGDILALLRIYAQSGSHNALYEARTRGDFLLNAAFKRADGSLCWSSAAKQPLAGFAHGAAGIGYALAELFRVSADHRYRDGAIAAFAYEHSLFSQQSGGWPDLRERKAGDSRPPFPSGWCHGGVGIGLSRLGSLDLLDRSHSLSEIEVAASQAQSYGASGVDQICCGAFSRVEFLVSAGRTLGRHDYIEQGNQIAQCVVDRANRLGGYACLHGAPRSVLVPGLFNGIAGIGYQLLRLLAPEKIPSIQLFG